MENNIQLFDQYIDGTLPPEAAAEFEARLKSDDAFRRDFQVYLFTLKGIIDEARQSDIEFGHAMKHISNEAFREAIGRNRGKEEGYSRPQIFEIDPSIFASEERFSSVAERIPEDVEEDVVAFADSNVEDDFAFAAAEYEDCLGALPPPPQEMDIVLADEAGGPVAASKPEEAVAQPLMKRRRWERVAWISSIAALLVVGVFTIISVSRSSDNRVDDVIAYYNQWTTSARGGNDTAPDLSSLSGEELISAIATYRASYDNPDESVQDREMAGYTLAVLYIQNHDRPAARHLLEEMTVRFADDKEFVDSCRELLNLIK